MNWKTVRVLSLIAAVSAALVALLFVERPFSHKLALKAYFADGMNLRAGARVRLAGIDIGTVKTVRVRPELRDAPVEVAMALVTSDEIKIPSDSTARLHTAGLLGDTYVALDISNAIGPPITAGAVLKTAPSKDLSTQDLLNKIDEMLSKKVCDLQQLKAAISASEKSSNSAH